MTRIAVVGAAQNLLREVGVGEKAALSLRTVANSVALSTDKKPFPFARADDDTAVVELLQVLVHVTRQRLCPPLGEVAQVSDLRAWLSSRLQLGKIAHERPRRHSGPVRVPG